MIIKKSTLSTIRREAQYLQQYDYLALQQFYLDPYRLPPRPTWLVLLRFALRPPHPVYSFEAIS